MDQLLLHEIDLLRKDISKLKPLSDKNLQELKEYFRIGLTYSSNALEGNSLTESETKILLEEGITIGGKSLKDHFEATGHDDALKRLFEVYKNKKITEHDIQEFHRLFYYRIDETNAGIYRSKKVFITGSKYPLPQPKTVPGAMRTFIKQATNIRKKLHPVHFAAHCHKEFVFIHPFIDGNGRVARLLMNLILLQEKYLPAVIPPVLRADYISALEEAHEDETNFLNFIGEAVRQTQKDYLRIFR